MAMVFDLRVREMVCIGGEIVTLRCVRPRIIFVFKGQAYHLKNGSCRILMATTMLIVINAHALSAREARAEVLFPLRKALPLVEHLLPGAKPGSSQLSIRSVPERTPADLKALVERRQARRLRPVLQ